MSGAAGPPTVANRLTAATRRGARSVLNRRGLFGTGLEFAWWATHAVTYPMGVAAESWREDRDVFRLDGLSPLQRSLLLHNVEAAGTPILLVHGLVDNRSVFSVLRRTLTRRGFGRISSFNYSPLSSDIRAVAHRMAIRVEHLCEQTGYERIHVVAHSMGGLVARYYIQELGGDERIHTLVTLGTPHSGTVAAHLVPTPIIRQMRPGSDVLRQLNRPAPGCRTRFLAIWSDLDQMMVPKRAARIEHPDLRARNVLIRGVGHLALPVDRAVVHEIATALAHIDSEGTTLAEGATSIAATPGRPATALPPPPAPTAGSPAPRAGSALIF